jgi:hypothetical protein
MSSNGSLSDNPSEKSSSSQLSSSVKSTSVDATFEIQVDGKPVIVAGGNKNKNIGTVARGIDTIFVSMTELSHAIERARKRRRPSTTYGGGASFGTLTFRQSTKRS